MILAIAWMAMIFYFSAQTAEESTGQSDEVSFILGNIIYKDFDSWSNDKKAEFADRVSSAVRKTAHMIEYGILCFLWFEALGGCVSAAGNGLRPSGIARGLGIPFLITVIYASTDEFHQRFVTGRTGKPADVLIDACGALIVCVILVVILLVKNRRYDKTIDAQSK